MRKKLNELYSTFNVLTDGFILNQLVKDNKIDYLTNEEAIALDNDYFLNHSNEKTISPLLNAYLESGNSIESIVQSIATLIYLRYGSNWQNIYDAYNTVYKALENYSMIEESTDSQTADVFTEVESKVTTSNKRVNNIYGFDSSTPTPATEEVTDGESVGNVGDNYSQTDESRTNNHVLTRSGNIGVTTSQQMLQSEIELRQYDFYASIFKDLDKVLCLRIYVR